MLRNISMKNLLDVIFIKEIVFPLIIILISILVYFFLKNLVVKLFKFKSKMDVRHSRTIKSVLCNLIKYFIIVIDVVMILDVFGIDTKTLIASLGVVGVVAGLSVQDSLKDFIAGMSIIFENQYHVGDFVTIRGFRGEVIDLGIKTTKIKSYTGEVMIIANHLVEEVINHSYDFSMAVVDIPVSYDISIDFLEDVLDKLFQRVNKEIKGLKGDINYLGLQSFGDSALVFRVVVPCTPSDVFSVERKLKKLIFLELENNNIEIPYNQVVVHNGKKL